MKRKNASTRQSHVLRMLKISDVDEQCHMPRRMKILKSEATLKNDLHIKSNIIAVSIAAPGWCRREKISST